MTKRIRKRNTVPLLDPNQREEGRLESVAAKEAVGFVQRNYDDVEYESVWNGGPLNPVEDPHLAFREVTRR